MQPRFTVDTVDGYMKKASNYSLLKRIGDIVNANYNLISSELRHPPTGVELV